MRFRLPQSRKFRVLIIIWIVVSVLTAVQVLILKSLDYSTAEIEWISPSSVDITPTPGFQIGDVVWNTDYYSNTADLGDFRQFFESNCTGLEGIPAARCVSERLLVAMPFGEPSNEMFQPTYSPTKRLSKVLNGEPGHCVTISSMTVNSLLAAQIPARMIQTLPKMKPGHNLIEVWDQAHGWIAFDPLNVSVFSDGSKLLSAAEAHETSVLNRIPEQSDDSIPRHLSEYYVGENPFSGTIMYIEPWLHARTGERKAFMARATFLALGHPRTDLRIVHPTLRYGIFSGIVISAVLFILLIALGVSAGRGRNKDEADAVHKANL